MLQWGMVPLVSYVSVCFSAVYCSEFISLCIGHVRPDSTLLALAVLSLWFLLFYRLTLFSQLNKYLTRRQMSAFVCIHSGWYISQIKVFLFSKWYRLCLLSVDCSLFLLRFFSRLARCRLPWDVMCVRCWQCRKRETGLLARSLHTQTRTPPKSLWGTGHQLGIVPLSDDLGQLSSECVLVR